MKRLQHTSRTIQGLSIIICLFTTVHSAALSDILNLNTDSTLRLPRDSKYYLDRQGSDSHRDVATSRLLKPEETPEARDLPETTIGKRCTRCETGYSDYRSSSYYPKSDYRYQEPRDPYRRYEDRYDRYDPYDRQDPYDAYDSYDRDSYRRPYSSRESSYDRYEPRDRYSGYSGRDRYDRYDRQYDRGVGYDNIGYDYRGYESRGGHRPYDETYRGTSGWDSSGRGYYSSRGAPESSGRYGGVYASSWGYGRDDRDRTYRDPGAQRGYRPRDYHSYGTSYLYDRASSTSTSSPGSENDRDNSVTDAPSDTSSSDPVLYNIVSLPLKIIDKHPNGR